MIERNILLNPGPATTSDTVKLAQVVPDICPREKEFVEIMRNFRRDLLKIVHVSESEYASVLFCGSGTINIDVCLNSLLPAGKKVLIVKNGAYSARAVEVCQYYGLPYINLSFSVTELPDLEVVEKVLRENNDIAIVHTTHNETGTGILNPIREIGALAHRYNAVFTVDTTSTLAMLPIDMVKDNIDFCMASAQKGLMAMTGLSFIIGNKKILEASAAYPKRSYYCNLYMQYKYFEEHGEMHFTPPVQTIYAAVQALREYFAEGEQAKWQRHSRVCEAIHEGLRTLGFREIIPKKWQSGLVVSVQYPDDANWNFDKIHDYCYERGYTIYPGKISNANTFRLCSLGAIDTEDIERFFVIFKAGLEASKLQIPVKYA